MTILGAQAPQYLVSMFERTESASDPERGRFVLRLFVDSAPKDVVIDDYVPCGEALIPGGEPRLLATPFQYDKQHNRKIIWPVLVEKAIAKEYGSYEHLNGGAIDDALMLITGTAAFRYNLLNEDVRLQIADNSLWKKLLEYTHKSYLMGGGTLPKELLPTTNLGIVPSHAYAILGTLECDEHKLVELKNPWGESLWNGPWGECSNKWTQRIRGKIAAQKAERQKSDRAIDPLVTNEFTRHRSRCLKAVAARSS
jgi:hypothetical protein